jgi:predicted NAD/FAD-dependent oxidoreductase
MGTTDEKGGVVVVGAGMAGLAAATELRFAGARVVVLDKGRGVGGRMASRRIDDATFDHGAQFLTSRDARFSAVLEKGCQAGTVEEWFRNDSANADGGIYWRGKPAISAVAKQLALGLDVRLETTVTAVHRDGPGWRVETAGGAVFTASALVLTSPVPQSLRLLDAGGVEVDSKIRARLEAIEYDRCLAVMAILDAPSRIPPPGFIALTGGPIASISDNQCKGISVAPAVTIHATPAFSLKHWDADRQVVGRTLLDSAGPWMGSAVRTFQVHGWRYSRPTQVDEERCIVASPSPLLIFAGDAFGGSNVEGAALSGWAAAEVILENCSGLPGA